MSRKKELVEITDEGRDKGKVFVVTEMDADRAERWAARAFFALANSGAAIPQEWQNGGMAAIATIGLTGLQGLPYAAAEPLLDDLMACCQFMPDRSKPLVLMDDLGNHVEEVRTRLYLKLRAFVLHTGFSWADVQSRLAERSASKNSQQDSQTTPTSQPA